MFYWISKTFQVLEAFSYVQTFYSSKSKIGITDISGEVFGEELGEVLGGKSLGSFGGSFGVLFVVYQKLCSSNSRAELH